MPLLPFSNFRLLWLALLVSISKMPFSIAPVLFFVLGLCCKIYFVGMCQLSRGRLIPWHWRIITKWVGITRGVLFSSLLLGKIIPLLLVMIRWGHIPRPLKEEDVEAIFSSKGDYMEGDKSDTALTFEEFTFLQMAIVVKKKICSSPQHSNSPFDSTGNSPTLDSFFRAF